MKLSTSLLLVYWGVTFLFAGSFFFDVRNNADLFSTTSCLNEGETYSGGGVVELYGLDRPYYPGVELEEVVPDEVTRLQQACLARQHLVELLKDKVIPYLIFVMLIMILRQRGKDIGAFIKRLTGDLQREG